MTTIFIDSAALISAIMSAKGASRVLLNLAEARRIDLVTNGYVIAEVERNLAAKLDSGVLLLQLAIESSNITVLANPSREEVEIVAAYTVLKDAPVVAGAIKAKADYLATYDRKHLIDSEVGERANLRIETSGTILNEIRDQTGGRM